MQAFSKQTLTAKGLFGSNFREESRLINLLNMLAILISLVYNFVDVVLIEFFIKKEPQVGFLHIRQLGSIGFVGEPVPGNLDLVLDGPLPLIDLPLVHAYSQTGHLFFVVGVDVGSVRVAHWGQKHFCQTVHSF